jgi:hypothetical protein
MRKEVYKERIVLGRTWTKQHEALKSWCEEVVVEAGLVS